MANRLPLRADAATAVDAWFRVTLRTLAALFLVLLAVNSVAITGLNLLFEGEQLRPRQLWRPILARNAVLAVFPLLLFFHFRPGTAPLPETVRRVTWLYARLLRGAVYIALGIAAAGAAVTMLENRLFHDTLTLTRTPSQTLNLMYGGLIVCVALVYLPRARAAADAANLPPNWGLTLRRVTWEAFTSGGLFAALATGLFAAGAWRFIPATSQYMVLAGALYVFGGLLCGLSFGSLLAIRRGAADIVRATYELTEPVMQILIRNVTANGLSGVAIGAPAVATERPRSLLARLAQQHLLRSLRRHWVGDLFEGLGAAASGPEAVERLIADRVVTLTISDLRARLGLMLYATAGGATLLWLLPVIVARIAQAAG